MILVDQETSNRALEKDSKSSHVEIGPLNPGREARTRKAMPDLAMKVVVPDGVAGGSPLLVETPDLQQLEVRGG